MTTTSVSNSARAITKSAVKRTIVVLNQPAARRRFRHVVDSRPGPLKLEVGSSRSARPGWIPTDVGWRARYWLDVTTPWPVPLGAVSHVYGDNVIEHLTLDGARAFFRHANLALQPGGRIRLVSPDAERYARMYLEGGDLRDRHADRSRRHGYGVDHDVSLLRSVFVDCGHHAGYIWDLAAATAELEAAGFVSVRRCEVGSSDDPELCGLEARTEPSDRFLQLVVEALRP